MSRTIEAPRRTAVHPVDEILPVPKLAIYGFQHVLAFYAGAVIVPILLANSINLTTEQLIHLINADLFTCGIASIIQSVGFWKVGVRLPLLQGVTFTAVSPMIAIGLAAGGGTDGLLVIYGSVIVAGIFTFLIAPYFSKLIRFFPPVVTGTVITIIGIALLPVAAADAAGGAGPDLNPSSSKNLAYALGTKAAGTLNVEFYSDIEETLPDPIVLEPMLDTAAIRGKKLLVVDDVADSGRTLALVMDLMKQHGALARSAVLYTKPRTILVPDYSWRETELWITFPWSAQPPVPIAGR